MQIVHFQRVPCATRGNIANHIVNKVTVAIYFLMGKHATPPIVTKRKSPRELYRNMTREKIRFYHTAADREPFFVMEPDETQLRWESKLLIDNLAKPTDVYKHTGIYDQDDNPIHPADFALKLKKIAIISKPIAKKVCGLCGTFFHGSYCTVKDNAVHGEESGEYCDKVRMLS
jgi:hypothetical protein